VGCYLGRSLCSLAEVVRDSGRDFTVIGIDTSPWSLTVARERFAHPNASIRYLRQEADFTGFETVRAYVEAGLGPTDDPYLADYLLMELGLEGEADPRTLSGGEARRAGRGGSRRRPTRAGPRSRRSRALRPTARRLRRKTAFLDSR